MQCRREENAPIDATKDFEMDVLGDVCEGIILEPLRGHFGEHATLKKLIWFWRRDVQPIDMNLLNFHVGNRVHAAKTFASLMGNFRHSCLVIDITDSLSLSLHYSIEEETLGRYCLQYIRRDHSHFEGRGTDKHKRILIELEDQFITHLNL